MHGMYLLTLFVRNRMSVQNFETADVVSVTDSAANHFKNQLGKTGKAAIRISLKESGCTGYMYVINEVDEPLDEDLRISLSSGIDLFVDKTHLNAISGTVVDYRLEGVNKNLIMNNPNVKHECGCGESFNV